METPDKIVLSHLNEQKYALDLSIVERSIRIVDITPMPQASPFMLGVINMGGQVIPVLNPRAMLGLPDKEIGLNDHLLIALVSRFKVAMLVDEVMGVLDFDRQKFIASEDIFPGIGYVQGAMRLKDGIIFIYDLSRFLSIEDIGALNNGLLEVETNMKNVSVQAAQND